MKSTYLLLLILLSAVVFSSCNKCKPKVGSPKVDRIQLQSFKSIRLNGNFKTTVLQDSSYTLQLDAGENLIENIRWEMIQDTLVIYNENTCNVLSGYDQEVRLKIGCSALNQISLDAPGDLKSEGSLYGPAFKLVLNQSTSLIDLSLYFNKIRVECFEGSATINLKGYTEHFYVREKSLGHLNSQDLESFRTDVLHFGTGVVRVKASNTLNAYVGGSGTIFYTGNPQNVYTGIDKWASGSISKTN